MSANYTEALAHLLKFDIGRSAYFDVTMTPPNGTLGQNISYLCHSAELPGESSATVSQKYYGVVEKHAIMSAYNDITLSFYIYGSGTENVRKTFLQWITMITGRGNIIKDGSEATYNPKYKSEYQVPITITHYTATGVPQLECQLLEAYPIAISQVPLSWAAENQAIIFNVTFAYTEYLYTFYDIGYPQTNQA